jgi:hypothetical protein
VNFKPRATIGSHSYLLSLYRALSITFTYNPILIDPMSLKGLWLVGYWFDLLTLRMETTKVKDRANEVRF